MNKIRQFQRRRKDSVIALVLLAMVLLFVAGMGLLSLGLKSRQTAIRAASDIAAQCAADAGLAKALYEMNEKLKIKPWNDSTLPYATGAALPNCDATYNYTVTQDAITSDYVIYAIGTCGGLQRATQTTLALVGPYEYALLVKNNIELKNGTTIDQYNFGAGAENLQIGTLSTADGAINSRFGVTIDGDVLVGVGGNPDTVINSQQEAVITGECRALTEELKILDVVVPGYLESLTSQGKLTGSATWSGPLKYDNIDLLPTKTITIDGPAEVYVVGTVKTKLNCTIRIVGTNPDASLILYVGGDGSTTKGFILGMGATIANEHFDPRKIQIYGLNTCGKIEFQGLNQSYYGTVYAPQANVVAGNSFQIYGCVVANNFSQVVNANFHFDASLRDVTVNDPVVKFTVGKWSE